MTATVDRLRRAGVEVLDFGAGEPDFPTPEPVKAAARQALDQDFTKYTPNPGIAELRRAICDRYRTDYGVDYTESEVIVTAGGKQALHNTALALFGPGDEVITHAPYWPTLIEQIKLADATPGDRHHARRGRVQRSHADAMLAAVTPRTRGIIINSPCNPTGAIIPETELAAIADAAARRGIWLVVDLCYEKLIYDEVPHNLPAILVDALSRSGRDVRIRLEGLRDDRMALRLGDRAGRGHRGLPARCRATRRRMSTRSPRKRSSRR